MGAPVGPHPPRPPPPPPVPPHAGRPPPAAAARTAPAPHPPPHLTTPPPPPQRRVEIARALAMKPKLLLLDEPAAGLDAKETSRLGELLHTVRQRFHVSMLLVDHDMSLVMRVCDHVYVLDFGKLLARGQPAVIRDDPKVLAAYLGEESKKPSGNVHPLAVMRRDERPLLEVEGLAAGYGGLEVIRDVSLAVRPGEVVACIGANGAGKTTTLRAISGMIRARRGRVIFAG